MHNHSAFLFFCAGKRMRVIESAKWRIEPAKWRIAGTVADRTGKVSDSSVKVADSPTKVADSAGRKKNCFDEIGSLRPLV